MTNSDSFKRLSVIVPNNPFAPEKFKGKRHCLCALDVEELMEWWPGRPHTPHRDPNKVKAIQRSLDWKRVAHIAAYLLQQEITDAPEKLDKYFQEIYEPKQNEPGREWPPRIGNVIGFEKSSYPVFSNVLLHVNGATIEDAEVDRKTAEEAAYLIFNTGNDDLNFSVIDGQHRINGAYFAIKLLQEENSEAKWEIPAEIFLDLDAIGAPPKTQAQIFIDVNFNQKKVDRSLVADLFPTARGKSTPGSRIERAQDIGRKLMLETGPLVGMIQIPGIKYGVKDVITLATLNGAIEDVLEHLEESGIESLEEQSEFIAECLSAWFNASGRFESIKKNKKTALDPENAAYQGRVLVSILDLVPALIWALRKNDITYISRRAELTLTKVLHKAAMNAGILENGAFIAKGKFRVYGYLGSGGIGRFRNVLWAAIRGSQKIRRGTRPEKIARIAENNREYIKRYLTGN